MKHLQELEIGLKIIYFSHNYDHGGKSDWTRISDVSGELENQYRREEERGRVGVRAGAGDKRIIFHTVRRRISVWRDSKFLSQSRCTSAGEGTALAQLLLLGSFLATWESKFSQGLPAGTPEHG